MQAPSNIPRPKEGKLIAFNKSGWGNCDYEIWYIVDHTGRLVTQGDISSVVRYVNKVNNNQAKETS